MPTSSSVIRQVMTFLGDASPVAEVLFHTRGAPLPERVFGYAIAAQHVFWTLTRDNDPLRALVAAGYQVVNEALEGMLQKVLRETPAPRIVERTPMAVFTYWANRQIVLHEHTLSRTKTVLIHPSADLTIFDEAFWQAGTDLLLTTGYATQPGDWGNDTGMQKVGKGFSLSPLPEKHSYHGTPDVSWYTKRLQAGAGAGGRTAVFLGASGAGKTLLCRHIADALRDSSKRARAIVVPFNQINEAEIPVMLDLVRWLRPSAIILNDVTWFVELGSRIFLSSITQRDLAVLEALRDLPCPVLVTEMHDAVDAAVHYRACLGIRPGRVDEFFHIRSPDQAARVQIIHDVLGAAPKELVEDLAHRARSLPGAHVHELAKRVQRHGWENLEEEIKAIFLWLGLRPPTGAERSGKPFLVTKSRKKKRETGTPALAGMGEER